MNKKENSNLEVGIIGAGAITTTLHLPLLSAMSGITAKYVVDVNKPIDLAKNYKIDSYDTKDLGNLPDCDIILIATPVGVREEYIKEFSKRQIPIFTEKPFAINLKDHQKFLKYSNDIGCNYMKIWYNSSKMFESIISSKMFGDIEKISIKEGGIIGKTNRGSDTYQSDKKLSGGGVILEASCHTLSVLTHIFKKIYVENSKIIWEKELDVEAKIDFKTECESSIIPINYEITYIRAIENGTTIFFKNCYITFDHLNPRSDFIIHNYKNQNSFILKNEMKFANSSQQAYYLVWKNFIEKVRNGEELKGEELTSIKTTELISKIYDESVTV